MMTMARSGAAVAASLIILSAAACRADVISPHINNRGKVYSKEPPNSAMYGTGVSGRMAEASHLRYEGEQDLNAGEIEPAVAKLAKAVQLDPGDPTGHVLYARAITAKFYAHKQVVNEELLSDCISEWKMIWRHDADLLNQREARGQAVKLLKISRRLEKAKKELSRQMVAKARRDADTASRLAESPSQDSGNDFAD